MQPLIASELVGNWTALLLPFNADDSIDYDLLGAEIDALIAAQVSGIYSNGSAGEFYAQEGDEFERVSRLLAEKCEQASMPFQIGACATSAQEARSRLRYARQLRPSAMQIILPDWFVPSWPELLTFLQTMIEEAAPIPLVLYNPPHAKRRLSPAEWIKIVEAFPGIVGIKVPGGDQNWYRAMEPVLARISVFTPGHTLARGLASGARGAYSNVACLSPSGAQRWYTTCCADPGEGLRRGERIEAFWVKNVGPLITEQGLSNMAADKAAAAAGGWLPGLSPRLRWPYRSATLEAVERLRITARQEVPELFNADR